MKGIIVTGRTPRDLDFVLAVCREKVRRGDLSLATNAEYENRMAELVRQNENAGKEIEALKARISELEGQTETHSGSTDDATTDTDDALGDIIEVDLDRDVKDVEDTDTKDVEMSDDNQTAAQSKKGVRKS